jgi:hypothetical protein
MAAVQCPHDANPREHQWAVVLSHKHQRFNRGFAVPLELIPFSAAP